MNDSRYTGFNYSLTKNLTLMKFSYDIDGVSGVASYPGVDITNDHLQATTAREGDPSIVFITNTDPEKSIVIHKITVPRSSQQNQSNTYPAYFGTLAVSGSTGDIVRYQAAITGTSAVFKGPFVLPRGKALMHHQLKGPYGNPATLNYSYNVIVDYNLTDAPPSIEMVAPG